MANLKVKDLQKILSKADPNDDVVIVNHQYEDVGLVVKAEIGFSNPQLNSTSVYLQYTDKTKEWVAWQYLKQLYL